MKVLLKILSYPLSVIFWLLFGFTIVLFHPIQWLCFNLFGYQAHKKSVDYLNFCLARLMHVLFLKYTIENKTDIPKNIPLIIVSNHQSMWDISPIIWFLRRCHPKFISKVELGKGIPSISYNLRHGGSILIDRKKPELAIQELKKFANYLNEFKRSGVIFPEGTRSRNGIPKPFKPKGLTTLFKAMPDGYILPVTINNSWKLQRFGMFPIPLGVNLKMTVHPYLKISEHRTEDLVATVEKIITSKVIVD